MIRQHGGRGESESKERIPPWASPAQDDRPMARNEKLGAWEDLYIAEWAFDEIASLRLDHTHEQRSHVAAQVTTNPASSE